MIKLLRRYPVVSFVVLAYAITWLFRIPLAASAAGLIPIAVPRGFQFVGDFGPMVAAVLVTLALEGTPGVRTLLARVVRWRVGIGWYVAALAGPLVLFGSAALVAYVVLGAPLPDVSQLGRWPELPMLSPLATWFFLVLTIGLGEEVGWRGFALPRLQTRRSALQSSLLVGVMWVFWHAPTFVFDEAFASMSLTRTVGWALLVIAGSVVLAWLYNGTGGSLLIPILFHGTQDWTMASLAARDEALGTVWAVLFFIITILIVRTIRGYSRTHLVKQRSAAVGQRPLLHARKT